MCNGKDAERLIREAKDLELNHPQEARVKYLEAAEIMLYLSTQDKQNHDRYVEFANDLYNKAKQIDPNAPLESGKDHHKAKDKEPKELQQEIQKPDNFNADEFISSSKTLFQDIGGLEELKEEIRFKIIEPLKHPDLFAFYGKKMGGGILMYGPPGCGKTLIAEATANEANATFFHVKSSNLKSKYVGETEKNISELFGKARAMQPSIIFFDEFEALGNDRTASAHAHEVSTVAQLLTEMDGMGTKDQKILLLAATNEPWSIDPALRREGRFGETLFIPPPDLDSRKSILKINMKNRPTKDIDWDQLAIITNN
ncbi:MAG: ATP-binding protein, partial [Candidatus Nanoarchaeia archaeon]